MHPLDLQEDVIHVVADESRGFMHIAKRKDNRKASPQSQSNEHQRISSIECLDDLLKEAQSRMPTSVDSGYEHFIDRRDLVIDFEDL